MGTLLARLVAAERTQPAAVQRVPVDYLARLLAAIDPDRSVQHPPLDTPAALPGIVEPLTARELEVLGLLAVGRSNRRIAEELVVTLDTVKKHVGRVLDKLGATNRTEAVARARARGLVP